MATPRLIKKYSNRRLYDTETSSYITLSDVKTLVLNQTEFQVVDAKTNEDLTRNILLQIILEEESGGIPMFSNEFLSQIIRSYGNAMQGFMGSFLDKNIEAFANMQDQFKHNAMAMTGENPMLKPDAWGKFLEYQGTAMQDLVGDYLSRSSNIFLETQQQLQKQAQEMLGGLGLAESGAKGKKGK